MTYPVAHPGLFRSQMSAVRSHLSSNKTPFVRTQVARYFFSLLICNLLQSIGALFNLAWIAQAPVKIGPSCAAHATIAQLGNVRKLVPFRRRLSIDTSRRHRLEQRFFH